MKPPDTPKTLLRRLADPEAAQPQWARFHALYEPIVRAWLRLRGLRGDALDESVQDVFVRLVRVLRDNPHDPARGLFRTYLGKIVHSVACDRRRARRRRHRLLDPPPPPPPPQGVTRASFFLCLFFFPLGTQRLVGDLFSARLRLGLAQMGGGGIMVAFWAYKGTLGFG